MFPQIRQQRSQLLYTTFLNTSKKFKKKLIKKWAEDFNRISQKDDTKVDSGYIKDVQSSGKCKSKTQGGIISYRL